MKADGTVTPIRHTQRQKKQQHPPAKCCCFFYTDFLCHRYAKDGQKAVKRRWKPDGKSPENAKKFQQNLTHYAHAKKTRNWRKSRYSRTFPPNPPPLLLLLSFYYIYFYIYIFKTALPRPCRNARRLFHRQLTVLSEKYRNHSHDFQGIFWKVLQLSENLNIIKRLKNILKTTGYRKDSLP